MIEFNNIKKEFPIFTGASRQGLLKALKIRGCTPIKKGDELWFSKEEITVGLVEKRYKNKLFNPENGVRFMDCVKYMDCLNKAAQIDGPLDCTECCFYRKES